MIPEELLQLPLTAFSLHEDVALVKVGLTSLERVDQRSHRERLLRCEGVRKPRDVERPPVLAPFVHLACRRLDLLHRHLGLFLPGHVIRRLAALARVSRSGARSLPQPRPLRFHPRVQPLPELGRLPPPSIHRLDGPERIGLEALPRLLERDETAFLIVVGGSARWLQLGPLPAVHPAEFAKLALVIYLAHWMAGRGTKIKGLFTGTIPFLLIAGPVIALIFREPDLGTTGVVTLTAFTMFFVAGANLLHLGLMGAGVLTAVVMVGLRGYQMERIRTWLDPWSDALGDGFHTVQGLLALGAGGLTGTGYLQGTQSHFAFLPEPQTDFVFATMAEEWGLAGGLFIIIGFALLIRWGIMVALDTRGRFERLTAAGLITTIFFYMAINLAMVMGLAPVVGIPLPLISYGGTAMLTLMFGFGLLISVYIHRDARIGRFQGDD